MVSIGSGLATMVGALVVAYQLVLLKRQETRDYLLRFNTRYDAIMQRIPLEVLLDAANDADERMNAQLSTSVSKEVERAVFDYFQLCEEQVTLFKSRVSSRSRTSGILMSEIEDDGKRHPFSDRKIWHDCFVEWSVGMKANFNNPVIRSLFQSFQRRLGSTETGERGGQSPIIFKDTHEHFPKHL